MANRPWVSIGLRVHLEVTLIELILWKRGNAQIFGAKNGACIDFIYLVDVTLVYKVT